MKRRFALVLLLAVAASAEQPRVHHSTHHRATYIGIRVRGR
jgi:hypothetical protein